MFVACVRHAAAVVRGGDKVLSEEGVYQAELAAKELARWKIVFSLIVHSSKTRARQTAEIFQKTLNLSSVTYISHNADPNGDPEMLWHEIDSLNESGRNVLIVSHLPLVEYFTSLILTRDPNLVSFRFSPASWALVELNNRPILMEFFAFP